MGYTYILSDIHGNGKRWKSIMEQIKLEPDDVLYIGGDVIDRHPDGIKIMQEIMAMPNAKMLLGNHEYMMVNALYGGTLPWPYTRWPGEDMDVWYRNGGRVTHEAFKKLSEKERDRIFSFLFSLPTEYELTLNGQKWLIVHAAPQNAMRARDTFKYSNSIEYSVWDRDFDYDRVPDGTIMVFGHTPTYAFGNEENGKLKIWHCPNGKAIGIDCGCGFPENPKAHNFPYEGRLACLRLDDGKEFYSAASGA